MRCDSHIHIVGPESRYPLAQGRTYTPGPAGLAAIEQVAGPLGVRRFVIVQPSFYGTDNTLLLESLAELAGRGRGVAVIDPAAIDEEALQRLHAAGVRGLRINLYSTLAAQAPRALDRDFAALAQVAGRMSWHIEVLAGLATLAEHAGLLAASPVPVVIDHYGLHGDAQPASAAGRSLLDLLGRAHVWMKLSAPYRVRPDPLATRAEPGWMGALLAAAPTRCVWGSDWPHTPPHELQTGGGVPLAYRALDYAEVVEGFRQSVCSAALAERVMVENAATLYGF